MSFFGFSQPLDLEREKHTFLGSGGTGNEREKEDIAVYTWGEDSYDGLGDELQERGDELNDETFGGAGEVGKDFDFSNTGLPSDGLPQSSIGAPSRGHERGPQPTTQPQAPARPQTQTTEHLQTRQAAPSRPNNSIESVWEDKSPFSVLPRLNGRSSDYSTQSRSQTQAQPQPSRFTPFNQSSASTSSGTDAFAPPTQQLGSLSLGGSLHKGMHTVEEIEAEMRAAAAAQQQQQQHHQHQQQQPLPPPHSFSQAQLRERELQLREAQLHEAHLHEAQLRETQARETQLRERENLLRAQIPRQVTPTLTATPPPRMHPHSQSPRFHQQQQQHQIQLIHLQQQQQQRHLLELQEQRERQEHQQLLQLQEQLRIEEVERQRQIRLQQSHLQNQLLHQRLSPALSDRAHRHVGRQSPALLGAQGGGVDVPFQQSMPYLPQDIQLQQRLLAEMAQAEFLSNMQAAGTPQTEKEAREEREMQEMLRAEAMRKIMEAERMEEKRRRKHAKIAHMSRYNDLMTQSDKDFITRIQVSQLVTQDPYADDFYAQVYGAILRSRMGVQSEDNRVLKFGSGGGVGLGLAQKGAGRRQSAMQRMEAQVERIVNNARMREKEKISLNSLQGALGKTSGRSYKAAPRQLLQVDAGNRSPSPSPSSAHAHISKADALHHEGATREAAKIGREALGSAAHTNDHDRQDPLTHREALVIIERLYDAVLDLEQLRRQQPQPEDEEEMYLWKNDYAVHVEQLWKDLRVGVPLESSVPHPFISLLAPAKGKRLLPRVARHLDEHKMLTVFTLLVACFSQLDVVIKAHVLDTLEESEAHTEVENQTQAFMASVVQSILPVVAKANLRLVSGLLGLLFERNNVAALARTRPGLALLTLFLSRVEVIKQSMATATEVDELPTPEETEQWQHMYDLLFKVLAPGLLMLFPSIRISTISGVAYGSVPHADVIDQPVWQFLAALALHAVTEQQQTLVSTLREVVLENITSINKGWVTDEEEKSTRLSNLNIFLRALGIDISQISV